MESENVGAPERRAKKKAADIAIGGQAGD